MTTTTTELTPAQRVKQARTVLGWGQRKFARKLGLRPKSVSEMESGKITPQPELLAAIDRLVARAKQRPAKLP